MATIAQLEAQIETLSRRNAELEQQLVQAQRLAEKAETRAMQAEGAAEKAIVESHIRAAALEAGSTAEPTAGSERGPLDDVVRRMMIDHDWKADSEGKPFRPLPNGDYDYTSPSALMKKLRTEMPPLFPKHQGGTDPASSSPQASSGPNPWTLEHWNQHAQNQYEIQHGTDKATAMAAAAGVDVYATKPRAR